MGEIAEQLIEDFMFGKSNYFQPTIVKLRFKKTKDSNLFGIRKFLSRFNWIKNTNHADKIISDFITSRKDLRIVPQTIEESAKFIQSNSNFSKFVKFVKNYNKTNSINITNNSDEEE